MIVCDTLVISGWRGSVQLIAVAFVIPSISLEFYGWQIGSLFEDVESDINRSHDCSLFHLGIDTGMRLEGKLYTRTVSIVYTC